MSTEINITQSLSVQSDYRLDDIDPTNILSHFISLSEAKKSNRRYKCKKCDWEASSSGKTRLSQHVQGRAKIGHPWDARPCLNPDPAMKNYLLEVLAATEEKERLEDLQNGVERDLKHKQKKRKKKDSSKNDLEEGDSANEDGQNFSLSVRQTQAELAWDYINDIEKQVDSSGLLMAKILSDLGVSAAAEMMLLSEDEISQLSECLKPVPRRGFVMMMKGQWLFRLP